MGSHWLLVVSATVTLAAAVDLVTLRIPNAISVGMAVAGLLYQLLLAGVVGFLGGAEGMVAGFIVFMPFYVLGWMGAGDVKLLMAIGACLGWRFAVLNGVIALSLGIPFAIAILLFRGGLMEYLKRYGRMIKHFIISGDLVYHPPEKDSVARVRFPFAFAIALGTVALAFKWDGAGMTMERVFAGF